jgi:hypothetical protein
MKSEKLTRRQMLGATLVGLSAIPVVMETAMAQAAAKPTRLADPAVDKAAAAIGYVDDVSKVDAKKNPNFKPTQNCGNCLQWSTPDRKAAQGGCNLLRDPKVNLVVKNNGWCKVWVPAPVKKA